MNNRKSGLRAEESRFLTRVMTMGAGTSLPVVMSPDEFVKLIGIIYHDNNAGGKLEKVHPGLWMKINPGKNYYDLGEKWFLEEIFLAPGQHVALMRTGEEQIEDFSTYLYCLAELHKRRRKYAMILAGQPLPAMMPISPRALIEYGSVNSQALASWLVWRKFFYDLDNRAAQETGYLFEPILAAAIGGEQKSAQARVVSRAGDATKGRQVDCWKVLPDGRKLAYEFKLRVTIAASGQGRFREEIQFAEDAFHSGSVPVLLVLDPTMNPRLDDLQKAYIAMGGHAYLGKDAWDHVANEAGTVMAKFIEKYVKKPIEVVGGFDAACAAASSSEPIDLLNLQASCSDGKLTIRLGEHVRDIQKQADFFIP